jgi:peptidoglycan-N-acetylglucosamine deacetylase
MTESPWPAPYRCAVSFTFDDARYSQLDVGMPIFEKHDVPATFYVSPKPFIDHATEWSAASQAGHEIGNHTIYHPCCRNFGFSDTRTLESYTLEMIRHDCVEANALIEQHTGNVPQTFAYPCGQTYVGVGVDTRSYVPVIAERFLSARCFAEGAINNPAACNMHQLAAYDSDEATFDTIRKIIDRCAETGGWVIFAGHEIGTLGSRQTTGIEVLDETFSYLAKKLPEAWVATMTDVATCVAACVAKFVATHAARVAR